MNRVLILCYNFSSSGGTGILRTLKFCKYLPVNGWIPIVIHTKNKNPLKFLSCKPDIVFNCKRYCSLGSKFVENIGTFFHHYFKNYRYILLPDIHIYTIIPTFLKALSVNRLEKIDLIYCSCSPYSLAISGVLIKKIIDKPLVVDLRDAWTLNPYENYPSLIHRKVDEKLERLVLNNCDAVIIVADMLKNQYINKYGKIIINKIYTIPNGFDSSDLEQIETISNKFTITYTGSFYGLRTPELFLKGFKRFVDYNEPNDIGVHFYGSEKLVEELTNKYNLDKYISSHSVISNKEVYSILSNSHLLLFIEPSSAIPTKLFEYMASGKPILAIIPDGEASELIKKYSIFSSITSENEDKIACLIEKYYRLWKNNQYPEKSTSTEFMSEFNREYLTTKLSNVFNHLHATSVEMTKQALVSRQR